MLTSNAKNSISAEVSSGWWSGGVVNLNKGTTDAFWAKLIVTYTDGTAEEGYQVVVPSAESETEGQVVMIPESLTLVGIRQWDPLSSSWVWLNNDKEASLDAFIKSEEAVEVPVSGTTVMYNKYVWDIANGDNILTTEANFRFVLE